eukprot:TRINITY_DN55584_c0_g1_i1.p1 TRINITY_DN55584_c0_g1~~TRINITY_DN55584_c0_g1_i1.p1  ORF type:complete len:412 (+),score=108.21 TRINITY_DN55584_c0_g1_i1:46-1281(+)
MIRGPPRSTLSSSSAASDVYKRQQSASPCPAPLLASNRTTETALEQAELARALAESELTALRSKLEQMEGPHPGEGRSVDLIRFQEIDLIEVIGSGSEKEVHRGNYRGEQVAVMVLKVGRECATEASVFAKLGRHPHLTRMIGISTDQAGRQCLVSELAEHGSLDKLLDKCEEDGNPVGHRVLARACLQLQRACEQLYEHGMIHRDIAARNVLVFNFDPQDESSLKVKLTDYGLTKEGEYYYGGGDGIPMRWVPPEVIRKRKWSEKSDVWAFGVTMWEMWSAGEIPFAFQPDDEQVAARVVAGERLPQPENCPGAIYGVMQQCWQPLAKDRPSFSELEPLLLNAYCALGGGDGAEDEAHACVVCYDQEAVLVTNPCGHCCLCEQHSGQFRSAGAKCPICRGPIQSLIRLYR